MVIIGVDYHPSFQTIAFCVEETGEWRVAYSTARLNLQHRIPLKLRTRWVAAASLHVVREGCESRPSRAERF
jgi:hypothetical protein